MPGFYHMFPALVQGKLCDLWKCDKCGKIFAFENGEMLYCTKCRDRGYPLNADPEPGQSELIAKP